MQYVPGILLIGKDGRLCFDGVTRAGSVTIGAQGRLTALAANAAILEVLIGAAPFPAGGTGTAAGGWDTAANRDNAIAQFNSLRLSVIDIKNQIDEILIAIRNHGIIVP